MAQKNIFELDLLSIVSARTHATIAAVIFWSMFIFLIIMSINSTATTSVLELVMNFLLLGVMIWQIVAIILLQSAMGIGLLDPCPECTRVPQVI